MYRRELERSADSAVQATRDAAIRAPASGHTVIVHAADSHDPVGIYVARD